MCQYQVPCHYCGTSVLANQPDNSKFPIETVYCRNCWKLLKKNDTRIIGVLLEKNRKIRMEQNASLSSG